jgi:DNA polymerase-3 subunit alpha
MHPLLKPILKETFGVVLYQEQVMKIVQVLAGFTLGQADLLRRAMGKKKHSILMAQKENFIRGAKENGIEADLANTIFDLLTHFADYGFNKSHSAAYAFVAYETAYLKAHYPQEFMAAMLSSIMDVNDKVSIYIEQCKHMGIKILPPDINASTASFSVDKDAIRFGLAAVRNVGEGALKTLMECRDKNGKFKSLLDFCSRVDMRIVNKRVIESLIKCGSFDSLGGRRSQLLAVLDQSIDAAMSHQRDAASGQIGLFGEETMAQAEDIKLPDIPEEDMTNILTWEKEITGFYITGHPLDKYNNKLENLFSIKKIVEGGLKDNQLVRFGGMITTAKRITTKKGDTMCFLTVEDFTHSVEIVVFPRVFYQNMNALAPDLAVIVQGRMNLTDDGVKVIADNICLIEEYKPEIYISIHREQETDEIFTKLKKIFSEYHGEHVVYLHLLDKRQRIKTEQKYWMNQSPAAVKKIEELLGENSVQQR